MCETLTWLASGHIVQFQDMECNRDEALRSRDIAEQKFLQHDLVGAKRSALKAQCLFPDLDGLHQLLAVLDVHLTAQQKINGLDLNWYGILQTDATADHATIRKQYRKLALILHPDKNKAVGADGAFKLISEAWRILSDKARRAEYDAKRNSVSSPLKCSSGFRNFFHFTRAYQPKPTMKSNAFSNVCPSCKIPFERFSVEENKKLTCPSCGNMFTAENMKAPDDVEKPTGEDNTGSTSNSSRNDYNLFTSRHKFGFHWAGIAAKYRGYNRSTTEMVHDAYQMVKKQRLKAEKEAHEKLVNERMEEENARKKHMKEKYKANEFESRSKTVTRDTKQFGNFFVRAATFSYNCGYANNGEGSCSSFLSQQDYGNHEQQDKLPGDGYRQEDKLSEEPDHIGVSQKCGDDKASTVDCQYILSSKRKRIDA